MILSDVLTVEDERQLLQKLLEQVGQRAQAEREIELQHSGNVAREQNEYQQVFHHLTDNYETERIQLEQSHEIRMDEVQRNCQAESAQVQSEFQRVLTQAEERYRVDHDAATKEHDEAVWLVSSLLDDDSEGSPLQKLQQSTLAVEAAEIELKAGVDEFETGYQQVVRFLQRSHIAAELPDAEPSIPIASVDEMKAACLAALNSSRPIIQRILAQTLPTLFIGVAPILVFLAFSSLLFGVLWGLVDPTLIGLKLKSADRDWLWIALGISGVTGLLPTFFLHLMASHRVMGDYEELNQLRADARFTQSVWNKTSRTELNILEAECSRLQEMRVKRRDSAIQGAKEKLEAKLADIQRIRTNTVEQANQAYPAQLNFLEARRDRESNELEAQYQTESESLIFRRESDFRTMQAEFDSRTGFLRRQYQHAWMDLIRNWQSSLAELAIQSDRLCTTARAICPPWKDLIAESSPPITVSPKALSLGLIDVSLNHVEEGVSNDPRLKVERLQYDVPILLPLLSHPSLIIKTSAALRDQAVKVLQACMLRYLTSLPAGKVRFTIIDPVGLGANFSAFMHLADFDELLVTSRIWTEPSHIEKRLADLTEHMETILQTYLRNEFATIDDYNEFAGEVAEPYRVVVIANFPANFTDVALRRLVSIADGGRRCGVYLLMSIDSSQELPRSFRMSDLEHYATVLEATDVGFRHSDPDFYPWPLKLDTVPNPDEFGKLVRMAGQEAREMRRVEVPFERVAPPADQFWSRDSRSGIDIPIGRAGATKLQSMRLGKGTSQHVLIAGKTGSGKSTLLHALITNLALFYSPDEVEFYLIDFKKGVEFKVYAEEQLPHARVIAIESDREFGVSVLERLDLLLRDRGELFRDAGVQDIAGYRNARPNEVMPRTLLLIDEFQEFFVEDDVQSQEAALLLDRLIRQGRAFGVHVILGSQTLAGAYSLARSTLGQVAVRIALQCSETDAHLILSEENTAARLLTRPGEAIYNDANGMIEGNHPFQVVWLAEETRENYLRQIRAAADQRAKSGSKSSADVVVFEGNRPAIPAACIPLKSVIEQYRTAVQVQGSEQQFPVELTRSHCWLGDSVSLAGPIQLNFSLREGSNLLVVGRDEPSALGVMIPSALALLVTSSSARSSFPTISVLDGSLPNSTAAEKWRQFQSRISEWQSASETSDLIELGGPRDSAAIMGKFHTELERRSSEPGSPCFLFIFDLARFRDLRKADDDYGFSSGFGSGEKVISPGQMLTDLLRDGPAAGIFVVAWVDSYQTATRWLSRDQLNRFEDRIAFAMNVNDSSSLIDNPVAGRLGENRGVLYRGQLGIVEKFRPFSVESAAWLDDLSSHEQGSGEPPHESEEHSTGAATVIDDDPAAIEFSEMPATSENHAESSWSDELPNIDDLHVQ